MKMYTRKSKIKKAKSRKQYGGKSWRDYIASIINYVANFFWDVYGIFIPQNVKNNAFDAASNMSHTSSFDEIVVNVLHTIENNELDNAENSASHGDKNENIEKVWNNIYNTLLNRKNVNTIYYFNVKGSPWSNRKFIGKILGVTRDKTSDEVNFYAQQLGTANLKNVKIHVVADSGFLEFQDGNHYNYRFEKPLLNIIKDIEFTSKQYKYP